MTGSGDVARDTAGGPWWWTRRRGAVLDVVLAVASAVECVLEGNEFAHESGLPTALGMLFGLLVGSTLLFRRRWPVAAVLISIAVTPAEMGLLLSVSALYTLAASDVPRRIIGLLVSMEFFGSLIILWVQLHGSVGKDPDFDPGWWFIPLVSVTMSLVATAPPMLLGLYIGARRRLVESLRERADGLERELSLLAERAEERAVWARDEERRRIAREMHDVVAHRVSLMVVHAAALQAVAVKDPGKAARNAALVGDMGRQALTELRTMLGVLRTGGDVASAARRGPAPGGEGARPARLAEFAASAAATATAEEGPSLTELETLVGESRDAGMVVELLVEGERRGYATRVERTAYRVVQEALTNVHKHAAGAGTRIRLAYREAELALQVENEAPVDGAPGAGLPSGGNGLVGMRERVSSLGGVFVSGPTDGGGFRVSAVIPVEGSAG
jgi:signal transduction histidine kinase